MLTMLGMLQVGKHIIAEDWEGARAAVDMEI